jgi:hypothetical protein
MSWQQRLAGPTASFTNVSFIRRPPNRQLYGPYCFIDWVPPALCRATRPFMCRRWERAGVVTGFTSPLPPLGIGVLLYCYIAIEGPILGNGAIGNNCPIALFGSHIDSRLRLRLDRHTPPPCPGGSVPDPV